MLRRRLLMMMQQAQAVWRTVVKTGTGVIVADDTTEGMPVNLEMQGNTEQDRTTGANIFDKTKITEVRVGTGCTAELTKNGTVKITATVERTGPYAVIKVPIALQANKTYYATFRTVFASTGRTPRLAFFKKDQLGGFLSYDKYTTTENIEIELGLYMIDPGQIGDSVEIDNIMISETENADYEPYTGNKPSPSPDYPQEILNAGKYNEETQRYEYVIQMAGKNLFNFPDIESASGTVGRKCNITNNIVISARADNLEIQSDIWRFRATFKDGSFAYVTDGQIKNGIGIISVSGENPVMEIQSRSIYIISGAYRDIQVEYGDKATEYEPYREPKSVTITSDRPVSHLDSLVVQDGQYGWLYGGKIYKVTGNENWTFGDARYYTGKSTCAFLTKNDIFIGNQDNGCKCDRLQYASVVWNFIDGTIGFSFNSNQIHMRFPNNLLSVSDDATKEEKMAAFKAYVNKCVEEGNPITVQYKLAEPEFVPLPEKEQAMMRTLKTYFQTTVVANDDNMFMQIEYKTRIPEQEV